MGDKILDKFATLFSVLFSIFIIYTVLLITFAAPISGYFSNDSLFSSWYLYIISAFLLVAILIFLSMKFLSKPFNNVILQNNILNKYKENIILAFILILSIILRVIWVNTLYVIPQSDFELYHSLAAELAKGRVSFNDYIALFPHVIGYPAILSLFYKAFGASVIVAQLLNIAFNGGIIILLYMVGKRLMNNTCGIVAALFWAFWPSQIFYNSLVSTESSFTFFMLICILVTIIVLQMKRSYKMTFLLFSIIGILCALTNAIRPFGMILIIAIIMYYLLVFKEKLFSAKLWYIKCIFCATMILSYTLTFNFISIAISHTINREVAKSPIGFTTLAGSNLNASGGWNKEDSEFFGELSNKHGLTAQQVHDIALHKAIERFRAQKFQNLVLIFYKHSGMWLLDNDPLWFINSGLDKSNQPKFDLSESFCTLDILSNFYYYVMLMLCGFCGVLIVRKYKTTNLEENSIVFIFIIVLGIVGAHLIFERSTRYHYPAVALFALIASYGLTLYNKVKRTEKEHVEADLEEKVVVIK